MNTQGAFAFVVSTIFDFLIFLVLTRLLLQLVQADFYNPVSQFVVRVTNPVLEPLRRLLPVSRLVDVASIVGVLALILVKVLVLVWLGGGRISFNAYLLLYGLQTLAHLLLSYFFWAVLIRVILSWVAPDPYNPIVRLVAEITEPVMAPARKILPPMGGLDLSPVLVLLGLQFLMILFGGR